MHDQRRRACALFAAMTLVVAVSGEAPAQPVTRAHPYRGLWVGEVVLDKVAQASARNQEALEPTADTATMRIILHMDAEGKTHLLSHVALLKGAGTDVRLFTDEEKLNQAIDQSKKTEQVIRRIETASFDMPRKTLPPDPLPEDFDPSTLEHEYELAHLLEGEVSPDRQVSTRNALVIDRWHRSNPFRHAFHSGHTAGYRIERYFDMEFDPVAQPVDKLTGKYYGAIFGLLKPGQQIVISGRFSLYHICRVAELNPIVVEVRLKGE